MEDMLPAVNGAVLGDTGEVELRLTMLRLSQIEDDDQNERPENDEADPEFEELLSSIADQGLREPIRVYPIDVDRYRIESGHRRRRVGRRLGWASIPAFIGAPPQNEAERAINRLIPSFKRKDIDPVMKARTLKFLEEECGVSQRELGRRLGVSQSTISLTCKMLELPAEVLQLISAGKLTPAHAQELMRVSEPRLEYGCKVVETAAQLQQSLAALAVEQEMSVKTLRSRVAGIKDNNTYYRERKAQDEARAAERMKSAAEQEELRRQERERSRREEWLRRRRQEVISETIANRIGWSAESGPTLEHFRFAALVAADSGHIRNATQEVMRARILGAQTSEDLLQVILEAACLTISSDYYGLKVQMFREHAGKFADAAWQVKAAVKDALGQAGLLAKAGTEAYEELLAQAPDPAPPAPTAPVAIAAVDEDLTELGELDQVDDVGEEPVAAIAL